jgi:hypothetical protein
MQTAQRITLRAEPQQLIAERSRKGFPDGALAPVPVSETLAANEALARRREAGTTVLPLAFGDAGLPVHPCCRKRSPRQPAATPTLPWPACPNSAKAAAGVLGPARPADRGRRGVSRPGSKPLLFRAAAGYRRRRGGLPAKLAPPRELLGGGSAR